MNKTILTAIAPLLLAVAPMKPIFATVPPSEVYENKQIGKITIIMENLPRGATFNQERVLSMLSTKQGDPFSQLTFDHDLKSLAEEYDKAIPTIQTENGEVYITIKLWQKPMIRSITWNGSTTLVTSLDFPFQTSSTSRSFLKSRKRYFSGRAFPAPGGRKAPFRGGRIRSLARNKLSVNGRRQKTDTGPLTLRLLFAVLG